MTHDLALYIMEALAERYGKTCMLSTALADDVTIMQPQREELLQLGDITLEEAILRLTPPPTREEILEQGCRNCGSEDVEIVRVDVNMREEEAVLCNDCGHSTVLPREAVPEGSEGTDSSQTGL